MHKYYNKINYILVSHSLNCSHILVLPMGSASGNLPCGVGFTSPGLESSESSLNRLTLLEPGPIANELTAVTCCVGLISDRAGDTSIGEPLEPMLSSCLGGT